MNRVFYLLRKEPSSEDAEEVYKTWKEALMMHLKIPDLSLVWFSKLTSNNLE